MILRLKLALKTILGRHQCGSDLNGIYQYPDTWLSARRYFGQYGEDAKITPLFGSKKEGYFVEVGAMEGIRFSNTYRFERRGWKGICVEPHPRYFEMLKRNRRCATICAAVGKEDKEKADFYLHYRGSLSTLDKSLEPFFRKHYPQGFGGLKKVQVPLMTLNTLLRFHGAPAGFDLLSIDTEGTDRDVLDGLDIEHWRPRVVIAEISVRSQPVHEYMQSHGYTLACTNPSNAIYCKQEDDAERVRSTAIVGTSASPKHPLD